MMDITVELINGMNFGLEYIGRDVDGGIDESAVILSIAFVRAILWLGDSD